jgi:hypothetical protein
MNYENKYLKYKEKYLSKKNQHGGAKLEDVVFGMNDKEWGKIIAENESGKFNREQKEGPIWIYQIVNGDIDYLLKATENKEWKVKQNPGLYRKAMDTVFGQSPKPGESGSAVARQPPRDSVTAENPNNKLMFLVDYIHQGRQDGTMVVIAESDDECIRILFREYDDKDVLIKKVTDAKRYALKDDLPSGIVYDFLGSI